MLLKNLTNSTDRDDGEYVAPCGFRTVDETKYFPNESCLAGFAWYHFYDPFRKETLSAEDGSV